MELTTDIEVLKERARNIRINLLTALNNCHSGHTGGSLSCADILAALYFSVMRYDPKNPSWPDRDRFIMSKGHAAPALYATLAEAGYFPKEELNNLRRPGAILQGHPEYDVSIGIEASTGSLGHGLSASNGIALAGKLDNKDYRVYTLLSDGELQEGSTWEAITTSGYRKLDNLCAIVDRNRFQNDGAMDKIKDINPVKDKFIAFGWETAELKDGHDIGSLIEAFDKARSTKGKPFAIIANTIKGKGVSIFENKGNYHGVAPSDEELKIALKELGEAA
ncbi:MAG: transketolase [Candidatus Dadabacteria bacterium]|nr:transketolase [Candidatus Dadabacteria bacterium]NIS10155.1 transketolase [Candidatus Dadabacteria bacterium]NIY23069.1 transketolase [Candidatus Dadabacteria bacterium]